MITKEMAITAHTGTVFYNVRLTNKDGTPTRARVNGKCKTWKRSPSEWQLPMKHGLRTCFYIHSGNCMDWAASEPRAVMEKEL